MSSSSSLPRFSFAQAKEIVPLPQLVALQLASYRDFLQADVSAEKRLDIGLHGIFKNFFPVEDFSGRIRLEFVKYELETPKYEVDEALDKGTSYAAPLCVSFRIVVWDIDEDLGTRSVRHVKEQDVFMGDVPLMTENATFVVNGVQRVVVSQMHRSPGVCFEHDRGRSHASGKHLFSGSVRPSRGSWLDIEFDAKDLLFARIDRKRKFLASVLLMALPAVPGLLSPERSKKSEKGSSEVLPAEIFSQKEGMSREDLMAFFYGSLPCSLQDDLVSVPLFSGFLRGKTLQADVCDAKTKKVLLKAGAEVTDVLIKKWESSEAFSVLMSPKDLMGQYLAQDLFHPKTGEVYAEAGEEFTEKLAELLIKNQVSSFDLLKIDQGKTGSYLRDTLMASKVTNRQEALFEIYRILRPGDPPTFESASRLFYELFFDKERYDLSVVGRVKTNSRLGLAVPESSTVLTPKDFLEIVRVMLELRNGQRMVDDIDSLSNRRIRSVGEMLSGHYQAGLLRLERSIRERMSNLDISEVMPQNVLNAKPLAAVFRDFFSGSQLSQLMDQTNPLSEVTHKRRFSALGPGGLAKDRASLEVRDVHPTHYGRVCPVETPEGQSIGLISSKACYASVDRHGFVRTPYVRVKAGRVTDEVVYLSAIDEEEVNIAQGNALRDDAGLLTEEVVSCRRAGEYILTSPSEVDFMDVSPKQILSVAASLIPFVENDDASRALMGANMQRQAVPLVTTQAPLVGTGVEAAVARDSGSVLLAKRSGKISYVDALCIVVVADVNDPKSTEQSAEAGESSGVDIYRLKKFRKTNASTCINQKPLVSMGQKVLAGDVLADGSSTHRGELALGRNVVVAFMAWHGYGFEDSIIVSERLVSRGDFSSVHVQDFEVSARDTKLGSEQLTRDIPGASEDMLGRLDESGVVYVGANIKPGDILVGKVTPKGDTPMTSEEKLLRAIFGEKAVDMRDTSLRVPSGVRGTVVDVRVLSRKGVDKDERSLAIERTDVARLMKEKALEISLIEAGAALQLADLFEGGALETAVGKIKAGAVLTKDVLSSLSFEVLARFKVTGSEMMKQAKLVLSRIKSVKTEVEERFKKKAERIQKGDDLPAGVLKTVRVFIAVKRDLKVGDKMAGRHGNKGVVSKILPVEDMPYLADGTPIDMILNPLGVPSRMNVGQVLETHLGWAARGLGKKVTAYLKKHSSGKAPSFDDLKLLVRKLYEGASNAEDLNKALNSMSLEEVTSALMAFEKGIPMKAPVFEGPKIPTIDHLLETAVGDASGQMTLYDGKTGTPFDRKITVGVNYMLKLHHLVEQKIHSRSVGPYSLITQQPLGGKAQFGGQRLGEMEVWALQGYGAAHTLREMLTVKSDDTEGRTAAYAAIVRGENGFKCGIPASFSVLFRELLGLCLDVSFLKSDSGVSESEELDPAPEEALLQSSSEENKESPREEASSAPARQSAEDVSDSMAKEI